MKNRLLIQNDVENGEGKEDDSDSDSKTSMVRYYQWKRGEDGYLTKSRLRLMTKKLSFVAVNGENAKRAHSL